MATIPDVTDLGARPIPQARAPRTVDQSGDILAEGIGQTARAVSNIATQVSDREDQSSYAQARSTLLQADIAARKSLQDDQNFATYDTRYREAMQKARETATGMIRSRYDRANFERESDLDIARGAAAVGDLARAKRIDTGRATLDVTLAGNRTAALDAHDEATRSAFINSTLEAISGAQAKGDISAQEAMNLRQGWTASYAEGFVSMQPVDEQLRLLSGKTTSEPLTFDAIQSKFNIKIKDSSDSKTDWRGQPHAGRKMEFYAANEAYNPNPGSPTIEIFSKDVNSKDMLGEAFSHLLPKVDPAFKQARDEFVGSIDSKQKEMLRGDYESQIKSGVFGSNKPTFAEWLNTTGGDAFFRGYIADQYPKEFYRPDQVRLFNSLGAGGSKASSIADYIDPAKRVDLLDRAQRQRIADENQSWTLSQRAKAQMQENASKDLDKRLANGELTPTWIEANRNRLSADDYRYAYKALQSDAVTNPSLYADLRERAGSGQDIRSEARTALQDRRISRGDYDRLVSEVESERPGWYKRGSEYISNMSGASLLNPDPAAPQLKAAMLDQWSDWSRQNPAASDRDAQSAYQDIVSHNMLIQRAGLPLPRLLVGGRFSPDLVATAKATVVAHEKGQMNDADYAREMEVLQRWKRTLDSEKGQASK